MKLGAGVWRADAGRYGGMNKRGWVGGGLINSLGAGLGVWAAWNGVIYVSMGNGVGAALNSGRDGELVEFINEFFQFPEAHPIDLPGRISQGHAHIVK